MEDLILLRLENYKKNRQEWIDKQNSHEWTIKERDVGSEIYGFYQQKEALFTHKILELEWVMEIMKTKT